MPPEIAFLQHFHFLRPAFALILVPVIVIAWVRLRYRDRREMFDGIIAPHLLEHLRLGQLQRRWVTPERVSAVFVLTLVVLLMGPTWRQQPSPLNRDDAALVLLLDVSSSMAQTDVQPSRLQRAKQKILDLLALRPGKPAALIVYSGTAHAVLPLTADREIMSQYLAAVAPQIMPRSGKFPEYTLPLVDQLLRESTAPATIMLFADGLGADSEQAFRAWFDERQHQLLVVGVGSAEAAHGVTPLERRQLETLAKKVGGRYISLALDASDMARADRLIDSHYVIVDNSALPWLDSGYWLVFPAMALFLLWFRKGWTLTWASLLLPLALLSTASDLRAQDSAPPPQRSAVQWFVDLWLTPDQHGRLLMRAQDYRRAAARFDDPMWKGMAYYHAEEFMLAAEYFSRSDSEVALFNEANARAHARDYVRALRRYDRLLAQNPDYPGARHNRDRVQQLVDDINRLSASQQQEQGVSGEDRSLGEDGEIPAQGADELVWSQAELRQWSADEILQDPATQAMWLRSVQQDPATFLGIKFSMQLSDRRAEEAVAK